MTSRRALLVRHPQPDAAYQALRYCRTNGARVDVFYIEGVPGGPFSAPTALRRSARQHGWRCAYRLWCADRRGELSIDHLVPLARGGTDRLHNLRIVCADCNERKGDMKLQSFRRLVRQRISDRMHGTSTPLIGGRPADPVAGLGQDRGRVSLIELSEQIARIDRALEADHRRVIGQPSSTAPLMALLCTVGALAFGVGAVFGRRKAQFEWLDVEKRSGSNSKR